MNQTRGNFKKLSFWPDFGPFQPKFVPQNFLEEVFPILDVIICCKLPLYAVSKKVNEPNLRKWQKT